ncbi:uncharacterized protein LOC131018635 [Salvia miltiorrhiza]|uniref:uncharacterized protein LOC131018635 n=1 Tax=Salvia miltiorrhiza TaxID=226208 RepID=UPI0025AC1C19|nr:uncharacterized protein LOC131018635 [Salvia miltiorrhiza]
MYSVKAGYNLALEQKMRMEASSSSSSCGELWKWIWNLEVIPKVKLFMWKCLANAIPIAMGLRSRNLDVDVGCRRCGLHEESLEHVLRECDWAATLWSVSPLRLPPLPGECSIADWFEKIRSFPSRQTHALFATLAWSIRYSRNMFFFQQKVISHFECLTMAFRAMWSPPNRASNQQSQALTVVCDRDGQRKVSCDVAWNGGSGIGIGVVMSEGGGEVVSCRFGFIQGKFSVLEGEALAVLEGLNLCRERGVEDAIIETDSQSLYWMLLKREEDLSYLGNMLQAITRKMDSLTHASLSWTPREGNAIVDKLTSFALDNFAPLSTSLMLPVAVNILSS